MAAGGRRAAWVDRAVRHWTAAPVAAAARNAARIGAISRKRGYGGAAQRPAFRACAHRRVEFRRERGMEIFDYDNVLLLPRKCRVESRSECDPSVEFGP